MFKLHVPHLRSATRLAVLAAAVTAAGAFATGGTSAAPASSEVVITIMRVKAVDVIDTFSKGDFYARVTINGESQKTPVIRQSADVSPNWVISQKVPAGKHDLKLEIFDKDMTKDDAVDVNPLDNNRVLEATLDTRRCRISGYGRTYRCGAKIAVTGRERKAAEVTFKVEVKK